MAGAKTKTGRSKPSPKGKSSPKTTRAKGGKRGQLISMETYRQIRNAYLKKPSINNAAKEAGVTVRTARKYIIEGRPEKNMPAILGIAKAAAQTEKNEVELTLRESRRRDLKELLEIQAGSMVELRLHNERTKKLAQLAEKERDKKEDGEIVEPSSKYIDQIKSHDMIIRLKERMLDAPDEKVTFETDSLISQMNADECLEYIRTGKRPEHLQ